MSTTGKRRSVRKADLTNPRVEAYLRVLRLREQLEGDFRPILKERGLSGPTYNVLRILRGAGRPGLRCADVHERLVTRVPDVTRLVDRLESLGFAERVRSEADRRVALVRLTPEGKRTLDSMDRQVLRKHDEQFAALGARELDQLNRLMEKLLA
jgi:DNA-binding MarR family transcriptional regulator